MTSPREPDPPLLFHTDAADVAQPGVVAAAPPREQAPKLPTARDLLTRPSAWRALFRDELAESVAGQMFNFDISTYVEPDARERVRPRVRDAVLKISRYESWRDVIVQRAANMLVALTVLAPTFIVLVLLVTTGRGFLEGLGFIAAAFGVLVVAFFVAAGLSGVFSKHPNLIIVSWLAETALLGLALWRGPDEVIDAGWLDDGVEAGLIGGIVFLASACAITLLLKLAHAVIWSLKVSRYPEEEIIQSLNLALTHVAYADRVGLDREEKGRLVNDIEWVASVTETRLPKALPGEDPHTDEWVAKRALEMATALRSLKQSILLGAGVPEDLGPTLGWCLVNAADGDWAAFAPESAETVLKPKRRFPKQLLAAVAPFVIVSILTFAPIDLSAELEKTLKTAFLPALGWLVLYGINWLDPQSGQMAGGTSGLLGLFGAGPKKG